MERVAGCRQTACRPLQVNGLRKGALGGARHEEGGEETQRGGPGDQTIPRYSRLYAAMR